MDWYVVACNREKKQNIQDSPFYPKYNLSSLMQSALMPNILETVEEVNGGGEPGGAYSRPVKYQATSSSSCGAKKTRKNFSSFSLSVYYAYVKKNKPSQLKVRITSVFLLVTTARILLRVLTKKRTQGSFCMLQTESRSATARLCFVQLTPVFLL